MIKLKIIQANCNYFVIRISQKQKHMFLMILIYSTVCVRAKLEVLYSSIQLAIHLYKKIFPYSLSCKICHFMSLQCSTTSKPDWILLLLPVFMHRWMNRYCMDIKCFESTYKSLATSYYINTEFFLLLLNLKLRCSFYKKW